MSENKFNILPQESSPKVKNFLPPTPLLTNKPTVVIGKAILQVVQKRFINTGTEETDIALVNSKILNTPVFSDIILDGGSYVDENNNTINFEGISVDLCLISVMNQKNIIATTLQGRNGTVKEYISDGDYQIKIDGKIYGNGANNYPQDQVQKLIHICQAPQAITVISSHLKMFDISNIVINSYTINQVEGIRNYQEFVLNCVSDRELILLKNA